MAKFPFVFSYATSSTPYIHRSVTHSVTGHGQIFELALVPGLRAWMFCSAKRFICHSIRVQQSVAPVGVTKLLSEGQDHFDRFALRVYAPPQCLSWTVISPKPVSSSSSPAVADEPTFHATQHGHILSREPFWSNYCCCCLDVTSIGAKPTLWARHPIFQPSTHKTTSFFNRA